MNDRSATTEIDVAADGVRCHVDDVEAFEHRHSRVGADLRMQLAVADVERDDMGRAALQETVGESARRGAGIEGSHPGDVDRERVERGVELVATTTDEPRALLHDNRVCRVDQS
jgi:hypothetical protein